MQQINTERQRISAPLPRQLPTNVIKQRTLPFDQEHVNKNSRSALNRPEKLPEEKQEQWPTRPLRTDLESFDTHRSLSTVPTYSSLSRHSPETRECATQITTLTPTQTIRDDQEISHDSPLPIDNDHVFLVDEISCEEIELMPIASGFGHHSYHYPTTKTARKTQPQIASRTPPFRDNQRDKNRNGSNSNTRTKSNGKSPLPRPTAVQQSPLPRPTAVQRSPPPRPTVVQQSPPPRATAIQRSPRSDTIVSPTKRTEMNSKAPKNNLPPNDFRRIPSKEPVVNSASPPLERRRSETMPRNDTTRPAQKYLSSPVDQQDYGRKPIRFVNPQNNAYPPPSHPSPPDAVDRPRVMRVANNAYVIRRQKQPPSDDIYDDYRRDDPVDRTRSQRLVRLVRDAPYRDDADDVYYVERAPPRRVPVIRRSPPTEYVYVDQPPAPIRAHRSRRPEIVYIDEDDPVEYEDEYIYVDEDGNEVDFNDKRNQSTQYVEYIHDDDGTDRRRSQKSRVIYVDDDGAPIRQERSKKRSIQPSTTRIVYE